MALVMKVYNAQTSSNKSESFKTSRGFAENSLFDCRHCFYWYFPNRTWIEYYPKFFDSMLNFNLQPREETAINLI